MPLVSVILRSYNYEDFTAEAIESVLSQTVNDLELIIVDDASKDTSPQIIRRFQKKDTRVKAIFHTQNKGMSITQNDGLNTAQGKYISFIDADDLWARDKLERQLEILEKNNNLAIWSEGEIIDASGRPTGETFTQIQKASQKQKNGDIFEGLVRGNFILSSSFITAKKNITGLQYCPELKYLSDWLFFTELARNHSFHFIEAPLVKYRVHAHSTNKDTAGYLIDTIALYKIFTERFKNALSKNMISELFYLTGLLYRKAGNNVNALWHTIKALLVNPRNVDARYYFTKLFRQHYPVFYAATRNFYVSSKQRLVKNGGGFGCGKNIRHFEQKPDEGH